MRKINEFLQRQAYKEIKDKKIKFSEGIGYIRFTKKYKQRLNNIETLIEKFSTGQLHSTAFKKACHQLTPEDLGYIKEDTPGKFTVEVDEKQVTIPADKIETRNNWRLKRLS